MGFWSNLPSGDWRNDGWTIVGGAGSCFATLDNDNDALYVQCPSYKGSCTVSFPIDITNVPDGAVITSITVKLRCARGTGTPPSGTPASITVATTCTDDTSKFTIRTIYPTSTPTTFEVATYSRDCLGLSWDIERLNKLLCRVFSYVGIFDLIRCYKFYVDIKYRVRPTITVDAPSGTVLTPSPVISWTYSQTDGDPQSKVQYKIFTGVQQADISFNPQTSDAVFIQTLQGDISSITLPTSLNPDTYWVYVRSFSSFGAKSLWVGRQFVIDGPAPNPPGVPDPTGTFAPGTGIIQTVPDSVVGSATLTLRDTSNLLSVQMADAETITDGAEFATTNCTNVRDTTTAFPGGSASWKMTASSAANMSVATGFTEVGGGIPITARTQFLPKTIIRSCRLDISYYDSSYTLISTTTGVATPSVLATWTDVVTADTTPVTAVYAKAVINVLAPALNEVHNIDHLGLAYGTNTPWSDGGHVSRNLLSAWYANAEGSASNGESWVAGTASTTGTAAPPGTGGSGATANKMTYAGLSPTLAFRASGTVFTSPTSGSNYTLNKPVGTLSGDLMLAFVTSSESTDSITPPAGWTLVDQARVDDGSNDSSLFILKRTAGGAEPTTWTDGSISVAALRRSAAVVSYSGAADASTQFIAEAQTSTSNNGTYLTTPTVYNTDPNAWRISAFVVDDGTSAGTMTANILPPSVVPSISYVGASSVWTTTSYAGTYTINKPVGVSTGDLMIAQVSTSSTTSTITAPTGWTVVNQAGGANGPIQTAVLKRTATSAEPTSWTGTSTGTHHHVAASRVVAYRNAADASLQFVNNAMSEVEGGTSITTPQVNNNNSSSWRVVAFAGDGDHADTWTAADVSERYDSTINYADSSGGNTNSITISLDDSNGTIGSGTYSKSATLSESYYSATAWIGIVKGLSSAPTPGVNETSRASASVGAATPFTVAGVFDSAGPVSSGNTSVSGAYSQTYASAAGWIGLIKPATPVRAGQVSASMATKVDISNIDDAVVALAGGKVAVTSQFIGSTAGTPYLSVNFYRANQLIVTSTAQGTSFGTGTWVKSSAVFDMPSDTTRMSVGLFVQDRAVADIVYFDRVSLALGDDTVYRPGTYRTAHPVWSSPEIQFADDDGTGFTDWATLPGTVSNPPSFDALTGEVVYDDHTVVPLTNRKYRARTVSYGRAGDLFVSPWGPDSSEFSFVAQNWWLKDIRNPDSNLQLKVKAENVAIGTTNTAVAFQPLGEDFPVVLSEGYKSDAFTLTLIPVSQLGYAQLKALLKSGRTLFLQSDVDHAWWVRPLGDLTADLLPTGLRQSNPLREIKVTFVQVSPEL